MKHLIRAARTFRSLVPPSLCLAAALLGLSTAKASTVYEVDFSNYGSDQLNGNTAPVPNFYAYGPGAVGSLTGTAAQVSLSAFTSTNNGNYGGLSSGDLTFSLPTTDLSQLSFTAQVESSVSVDASLVLGGGNGVLAYTPTVPLVAGVPTTFGGSLSDFTDYNNFDASSSTFTFQFQVSQVSVAGVPVADPDGVTFTVSNFTVSDAPEPAALPLLMIGLLAGGAFLHFRKAAVAS